MKLHTWIKDKPAIWKNNGSQIFPVHVCPYLLEIVTENMGQDYEGRTLTTYTVRDSNFLELWFCNTPSCVVDPNAGDFSKLQLVIEEYLSND